MPKQDALVTREYLDERLDKFEEKMDKKLDGVLKAVKEDNAQLRNDILGKLDKMEEDAAVHSFSHQRLNDEISDHEKRIKSLEIAQKS